MEASTLLMACTLMFIGGDSAGTAGGIKVGTFAVLAAAMVTEVRAGPNPTVMGRRTAPHRTRCARR
ncbi:MULTISPECIES: hypothetical protein [Streptomyces]|uniref:Uncharacterized protein n=2 Tax=Streptomyces TaxID=1883 RepID=A0A117IWX8_9ACTN|nr:MULTISPECIES: hypothetical protein [Streptomyces]KUH39590.1 hypothetical protein ATE80_06545 [Streptomyces kanasensis]UUS34077.1 hypothetical protein NRO40_26805 [Streptomyces changanensis]